MPADSMQYQRQFISQLLFQHGVHYSASLFNFNHNNITQRQFGQTNMKSRHSRKLMDVACKLDMTPDTDIDCKKSIQTQRLQIKPSWLEYVDAAGILMLAAGFIIYPVLMYDVIDLKNPNGQAIGYVLLPISILFGMMLFYKKLTENRLTKIETGLDEKQNRNLALEFVKVQGYKVIKNSSDILIAVREGDIISWPRQLNVLFENGAIYACVLTLGSKARPPSFFTAKRMIKDLQTFLIIKSQQATPAWQKQG